MAEPIPPIGITRKPDYAHGQPISGMTPDRPQSARFQAHEQPRPLHFGEGLTRRLHGLRETVMGIAESLGGSEQVRFGQITEINYARRTAGLDKHHSGTMQLAPFTRSAALGDLRYSGDPMNHPNEYAAMLYALKELKSEGAIGEEPNPDVPGTFWFKVIDPDKLTAIANRDPEQDKSLAGELTMLPGGAEARIAFVKDFLRANGTQLAAK